MSTRTTCSLALLLMLLVATQMAAQDPQLSQFYASPLYTNPALTGNTLQDRIILNYRLQWAGIPPGFETYAFSYDHNTRSSNMGYGGMIMHDVAGSNGLSFTQVAGSYSYDARLDSDRSFRAGLRLGYTMRSFDPSNFLFADQVIRDNAAASIETGSIQNVSYLDVSTGGLYYSNKFWLGISLNHLNRPDQSLRSQGEARLPMRTSIHSGYRFNMPDHGMVRQKQTITLAAHYKSQGKWDQMDIGGYYGMSEFSMGLWYRGLPGLKAYAPGYPNNDAVILMLGYETASQWKIVYSYDITVSWLTPTSGGAHEISLTHEWPKKHRRRRPRTIPCPKF